MAIINIFKKDKENAPANKPAKKAVAKSAKKKEAAAPNEAGVKSAKKNLERIYRVIRNPHITEKASLLAEMNQYAFKVTKTANKIQIKKGVQDYYGVDVTDVRIINIPERLRQRRRGVSIKPGYKKAIVTVKKGQKIDILPR